MGVATVLGDLALTGQLGVGVATQVTSLVAPFVTPMGVGVATAMPQVALAGQLGVGVQTALPHLDLTGALGVGVQTRMPTLAMAGALGVGVRTRGTATGAPFVQGTPTTWESVGGGDNSITLAVPAGVQEGELLVAVGGRNGTGNIATPAGWTLIRTQTGGALRLNAWAKYASASEPASYEFAMGGGASCGMMVRLSGIHASTYLDVSAGDAATEINPTPPTVTTTVTNTMVFTAFIQAETLNPTYTPPAGHVERADLDGDNPTLLTHDVDLGVSTRVFAAAAATGGFTWTKSGGTPAVGVQTATVVFAIRPGPVTLA